ncbi:MAG: hypothetical protein FGM46_04820 [Ferruginibacter sp.]|nr:hypothetical protein [Ferruginibacter sp.]
MEKANHIQQELSSISGLVSNIPKVNVYEKDIPPSYFSTFSEELTVIINKDNNSEDEMPSIFHGIQKVNVYDVPQGYFDALHEIINAKKTAKIVPIKRVFVPFKQMAAVIIIGIACYSIIGLLNNKNEISDNAFTDNKMILAEAKRIIQSGSLDEEIKTLNEKDINEYLNFYGEDVHAALVASSIDEDLLPEEEDYIFDDETLNKYLNKFNINNESTRN